MIAPTLHSVRNPPIKGSPTPSGTQCAAAKERVAINAASPRAYRFECLCHSCWNQFEMANEEADRICPECRAAETAVSSTTETGSGPTIPISRPKARNAALVGQEPAKEALQISHVIEEMGHNAPEFGVRNVIERIARHGAILPVPRSPPIARFNDLPQ